METEDKIEKLGKIIGVAVGGITLFTYLLYYIGRTYFETYYASKNLPIGMLNNSFQDFVFLGARMDNLVLTILFTAQAVGLIIYLIFPKLTESTEPLKTKGDIIAGYGTYIYLVVAVVISVIQTLIHPTNKLILAFIGIFAFATICWFFLIITEKKLISYIKRKKIMHIIFVIATTVSLITFPSLGAMSWGAFRSLNDLDKNPFGYQIVELISKEKIIPDIKWDVNTDNSLKTTDNLTLIYSNDKYLFLRLSEKTNNIYTVKMDDITSLKILGYTQSK